MAARSRKFFHQARALHLRLGRIGERAAARLFRLRNGVVLARNWRFSGVRDGYGELDLVVLDGGTLVFAEVKTRRRRDGYRPGANLSPEQKERIRRGAHAYCRKLRVPEEMPRRFDLVEIIHDGRRLRDIALHENYMSF